MKPLKMYLLHFVQTVDGQEGEGIEISSYWRCQAEDYDHAVEQLTDEVEHAQGEKVLFHELIKSAK